MHLLWIAFILHSGGRVRQLQINAIQYPKSNPSILWLKIPHGFLSALSEVAPCWDNACLYNSDKVAVPFVAAPLIFDSWHSNVAPFYLDAAAHCYLFQLGWAKKKGCIGWVLQAKTGASKHNEGLAGAPPCLVPLKKMRKILLFFR